MATAAKADRLQSPGWSLPRLILAGQAQDMPGILCGHGRPRERLTEGCLYVTGESLLLCWLLLQNTAVEIRMCYKEIQRLAEGSKDKQGQCCKTAARSLVNRAPFSLRVHMYHCCTASIHYCYKICKVRFPSIFPV